jgi:hypothetical protein
MDKRTRKNFKRIQKEINKLKAQLSKIELRPCRGDADIQQKENELRMIKREIYELEKEANQYALYISGIGRK